MGSRLVWFAYCYDAHLTHVPASIAVPAREPWSLSTHALWPLSAQHSVHVAVAVLWKARGQNPRMYLPYELVEILLKHVV
jgi:hypothetical protein